MQIVENTIPSLIKITEPKRLFEDKTKLSSVEIIESIRRSCGLDEVSAISVIRQMCDVGEISEELGATAREYYLQKNLSEFEKTRQALISAYETKPFTLVDGAVRSVLVAEAKTINFENGNGNGLIANDQDQELRGRKRKSKPENKEKGVNKFWSTDLQSICWVQSLTV